jgi:hypothetical protein
MVWEDYKTLLITPAIAGWEQFKQRFNQYRPYLLLLEFDREVELILQNIRVFDSYWTEFISFETNPSPDLSKKIMKAFQFEEQISDTLTQISSKLGITDIH